MAFHTEGLQQAIEIAGSQEKLGELVGKSQQTISFHLRADELPFRLARKIQEKTGVPLSKLIPGIAEVEELSGSDAA